jgi:predicted metallo-beta-lactamase superfamily hydrolase
MLHACFYTICLIFHYTSWHFYAFFGTNLLTSRHSASSLFSTVFVFQKSYTENILGIGRNHSQSSRYFTELPKKRRGDGVRPRGALTLGRRGPAPSRAPYV